MVTHICERHGGLGHGGTESRRSEGEGVDGRDDWGEIDECSTTTSTAGRRRLAEVVSWPSEGTRAGGDGGGSRRGYIETEGV